MTKAQAEHVGMVYNMCPSHPNRESVHGVLAYIDSPSDQVPLGTRGRKVVLTRGAAHDAIHSLLGMGIGYSDKLEHHAPRQKVGIITSAEVEGNTLAFTGYVFAKDFPEVVLQLLHQNRLGISYEIGTANIRNTSADPWEIIRCVFTGASILLREKAAYRNAWIALGEK